jgi:UDP-N-acetylmuramate: L-alanyl-gamma-D-glutamyl-meso-diaminopimelate ligase
VVIAAVDHPERAPDGQRFSAERLVADLGAAGRPALYVPAVADIVAMVSAEAKAGDVVVVMSNGAFGGIHQKLLESLERRS